VYSEFHGVGGRKFPQRGPGTQPRMSCGDKAKTEVVFWNNVCGNAYPARFGGMTAYPHNVIWFMLCLSLTASVI